MRKEDVKYDCSYFEGHIPCTPNKKFDVQCDNCSHYNQDKSLILHLETKDLLLQEIYKISNFSKQERVDTLPIVANDRKKILFIKLGARFVINCISERRAGGLMTD